MTDSGNVESNYSILYPQEADSILSKLNKKDRLKIIKRIDKLKESPEHFTSQLTGTDLCSLRAGDYRILLTLNKKDRRVFIVTMGHRENIYERNM